ncbi:MAG: RNA polymerase factor sigma-54 [Chlamydiales bacterium]|nr:RNA polymerase factor sigma-54 [Chlamydiales bacterium]
MSLYDGTQHLALIQTTSQFTRQLQRLMMSHEMQMALHVLQLPILELASCIEEEIELNPLLEYEDEDQIAFAVNRLEEAYQNQFTTKESFTYRQNQENSLCLKPTFFERLVEQAHLIFDGKDLEIAEILIGYLDDKGYLTTHLKEIGKSHGLDGDALSFVLKGIQTLEPFGVGARTLQESLLIQLSCLNKQSTLAYKVIDSCFDDLLHGRMKALIESLHCSCAELQKALFYDIAKLDMHPGLSMEANKPLVVTPDIFLVEEGHGLFVEVNRAFIPKLRFNFQYMKLLKQKGLPKETKKYLLKKISLGKSFLKSIDERNSTLYKIANLLLKEQHSFLMDPNGYLKPLTMQTVAKKLEVHESTITRAVANKYIATPRGMLTLRSFFTQKYVGKNGEELSSNSVKKLIFELIQKEDKKYPSSDETLSKEIEKLGFSCARRTVAKHRKELNIASAKMRAHSVLDI